MPNRQMLYSHFFRIKLRVLLKERGWMNRSWILDFLTILKYPLSKKTLHASDSSAPSRVLFLWGKDKFETI